MGISNAEPSGCGIHMVHTGTLLIYAFDRPLAAQARLAALQRYAAALDLQGPALAVVVHRAGRRPQTVEYRTFMPVRPNGWRGLMSGLFGAGVLTALIGGLMQTNPRLVGRLLQPLGFDRSLALAGVGSAFAGMGLAGRRAYHVRRLRRLGEALPANSSALVLRLQQPLDWLLVRWLQQQGGRFIQDELPDEIVEGLA